MPSQSQSRRSRQRPQTRTLRCNSRSRLLQAERLQRHFQPQRYLGAASLVQRCLADAQDLLPDMLSASRPQVRHATTNSAREAAVTPPYFPVISANVHLVTLGCIHILVASTVGCWAGR